MNLEETKKRVKDFLEFYRLREKTNIDFLFSMKEGDIPVEAIDIILNELENQIRVREIEEKFIEENFICKSDIEKEIEELENMKVDGEVFVTARNFAIKILKSL